MKSRRISRAILALSLAFCALAAAADESPAAVSVEWIRVLSGEGEPATWRRGEPYPARPDGALFAPEAVLSYSPLRPGDAMDKSELAAKARLWERTLEVSGRFSKATVFVVELESDPSQRGIVVEAQALDVPIFGGGAAYGSMILPLVSGRRTSLSVAAGANKASAEYRDDSLGDLPLVLDGRLSYDNDLLDSLSFSGNRLSGGIGIGPRLSPLCSLIAGIRGGLPLGAAGGSSGYWAIFSDFDYARLWLFGVRGLALSLFAEASDFPSSAALKLESTARLDARLGPIAFTALAACGFSRGGLDERELFDLESGRFALSGPEGAGMKASRFEGARLDCGAQLIHFSLASWLTLSLGPSAFGEAIRADDSQELLAAVGGGLRMTLSLPVGLNIDLGYAAAQDGRGGFVFKVEASPLL